jgi:hypothetical protein
MVQFAGGATAVQFRLVLLLPVPEAAKPTGTFGTSVQLLGKVVTVMAGELRGDIPAASLAATANWKLVAAANPDTVKVVPVAVPLETPFLNTV